MSEPRLYYVTSAPEPWAESSNSIMISALRHVTVARSEALSASGTSTVMVRVYCALNSTRDSARQNLRLMARPGAGPGRGCGRAPARVPAAVTVEPRLY